MSRQRFACSSSVPWHLISLDAYQRRSGSRPIERQFTNRRVDLVSSRTPEFHGSKAAVDETGVFAHLARHVHRHAYAHEWRRGPGYRCRPHLRCNFPNPHQHSQETLPVERLCTAAAQGSRTTLMFRERPASGRASQMRAAAPTPRPVFAHPQLHGELVCSHATCSRA